MNEMNTNNQKSMKFSFSNLILFISTIIFCCANLLLYIFLINLGVYGYLGIAASAILIGLSIFFFIKNKTGWLKLAFIVTIILAVLSWGYYLFAELDLLKYFSSQEELQKLIESTGLWGCVVYVLIQFLQVTFIPLPAIVTTMVGTFLFGPATATLLSLIGILLGSITAFMIGDKCGEKVVKWIIGEEKTKKYSTMLYDKGKYMFFLMMLFPVFPDDILCLVAGMTTMSFKFFITTILLTRPIGIAMTCYLGGGDIIPYTELWGLIVWAILILLMLLAFWIAFKYKDKIEKIVGVLSEKLKVFFNKAGNKITYLFDNFVSLFSKTYKTKVLLKRNKVKTLLLPEKAESLMKEEKTKKKKSAK